MENEKLPTVCPYCEHVIDNCIVKVCAAHWERHQDAQRPVSSHTLGCMCGAHGFLDTQDATDVRDHARSR